ncbi:uncharacterized protein At3g27210 [Ricinus communis]|uniref:Uncharacterized protein n=1 Tax=Ricinus communis TaxID=3988 RepID=B9RMH1_RICCO|nr:uncharacterized protein At3g27210 [Ricinus communis]EEF47494.1 conserved hypothetical protein [Ricinus communis]|eukprot:XP_002514940.1 uncharacterized protein At3g27210 [Ricinus communis]
MGNCVPAQKSREPAMNLKSSINPQENNIQIESPIKDNKVNSDLSMSERNSKLQSSAPSPYGTSFRGLSNREEMFFDSQPWIDSDIEDFLSVNGDFTPLSGASPLHQSSFIRNPQCDESIYISSNVNSLPESSPTDMKKQLIEFFRESFSSDVDDNQNLQDKTEAKSMAFYLPSKCRNSNTYESVNSSICSSEATPNGYFNRAKGKPAESEAQCCFPNFVRSLSFSERKKRLNSAYNGCQ